MKTLEWTPELVGRFWSGIAQTPLGSISFGKASGPLFLDIIAPALPEGASILDFGAGDGDMADLLIQRGFKVAAYEPAEGRVDILKGKPFAQSSNFLGVFTKPDGTRFDVILMTEVIEHVLDCDMQATMDAIKAFLKPGGLLIASTPNSENLALASAYCPVCDHLFHRWQHVHSWTSESLADHFTAHGFFRKHVHKVDFTSSRTEAEYNALLEKYDHLQADYTRLVKQKIPGLSAIVKVIKDALMAWNLIPAPAKTACASNTTSGGDIRIGNESTLIYIGTLEDGSPA
ncbi:MAG TPA: hypothetical protein DCW68_05555 [Rhodospirillaceae bacterium]|nr:MAG: hypothetical protein A2018_02100 [Alphaproteobacteria bacterium GWF2_58_20]HAU29561.1 hypothetical protein [Rhodospirillaceae bacterium]